MKIILDNDDIKKLIEKNYNGVTDVKLPDKLEIAVTVDSESFTKVPKQLQKIINTTQTIPPIIRKINPEEQAKEEVKQGVMASGGVRRTLARMG